jgi:hypothetical protein
MQKWIYIIFYIFVIKNLNSYTVSQNIHLQLEKAKNLTSKKEFYKSRYSLESLLRDLKNLNPLEIDLIKYFIAKIYLLENRDAMAISIFDTILVNNLLDKTRLNDIRLQLAKSFYKSESWRMVIRYLENMETNNRDVLVMRYDSYMALREYSKAYDNIIILKEGSTNIKVWNEYLLLSLRLGRNLKNINIRSLNRKFKNFDEVNKFYELFKTYNMRFASAELIENAIIKNLKGDYEFLIDEAIDIFINLYQFNRAKDLMNFISVNHELNIARKIILFKLNVKLGEFEEAKILLKDIEKSGVPKERYENELENLISVLKKN